MCILFNETNYYFITSLKHCFRLAKWDKKLILKALIWITTCNFMFFFQFYVLLPVNNVYLKFINLKIPNSEDDSKLQEPHVIISNPLILLKEITIHCLKTSKIDNKNQN